MKLQPESKKELLRIACGVSLCTAVMWVVFAALHLVGWVVFDYRVLLGGIIGCVHTVVDNLMAHRLHNLAQGGFDQGVVGGLAVFIDQCNFHGLISPVYCILEGSRVVCSGNPIYHITSSRKYLVFTV